MLGRAHLGRRAGDRRIGVLQVGRRVGRAAHLAGVAELVLGAALRAFALDVAVGQEHALDRVVELLDGPGADQVAVAQRAVDPLCELDVLGRVRRVRRVEADQVARPVRPVRLGDPADQRFRRDPLGLGLEHDRRAVGVVGADEVDGVALHPLEPHPDVRLDVLHDVPDVERAVGVRQRGRDEQRAALGGARGGHAEDLAGIGGKGMLANAPRRHIEMRRFRRPALTREIPKPPGVPHGNDQPTSRRVSPRLSTR